MDMTMTFDCSGRSPDVSFYPLQDATANAQPANGGRFALQHEYLFADNQAPAAQQVAGSSQPEVAASGQPEAKDTTTPISSS
jgi:hypothetical protein